MNVLDVDLSIRIRRTSMAEYQIGIENWNPIRKKPVLTVIKDNEHIKVASFNDVESAELFYKALYECFKEGV